MKIPQIVCWLAAFACLFVSGCGSIGGRTSSEFYPGVYPGSRFDIDFIAHHEQKDMGELWPFFVLDFPVSAAVDTVLLVWDAPYTASRADSSTNNISK